MIAITFPSDAALRHRASGFEHARSKDYRQMPRVDRFVRPALIFLAGARRQLDLAQLMLADLAETRALVLLEGSEADVEEHYRQQVAARRLYQAAIDALAADRRPDSPALSRTECNADEGAPG